jgi:branched-chain amino acid transport system substrate-binding protein
MRRSTCKLLGLLGVTLLTAAPADAEVRIGLAAPLTGPMAWAGGISEQAAEFAVADLNANGGVLGEQIELITADDYCDGEQAVAAANKLIADGVVAVFGHECSAAAIPASKIYADAGILLFAPFATNPKLTEQGLTNVFRMVGRDDVSGELAAELLAKRWGDKPIAIVHDGELSRPAEEVKKRLNARGIAEAMFEAIVPGKADYWDVVQRMRAKAIEVLYHSGYTHEAGLLIRQAREHGYELQLLASDAIGNEDFGLIAGPAAEGALITIFPFPSGPEAAAFAAKFTEAHNLRLPPTLLSRSGRRRSRRRARLRPRQLATPCARASSTPCSAASVSTPRATSPATRPSSGMSGRMGSGARQADRVARVRQSSCGRCRDENCESYCSSGHHSGGGDGRFGGPR